MIRSPAASEAICLRKKRHYGSLSSNLAKLRKRRDVSLQVFATKVGISIPRLRDAECFGLATEDTLTRLAGALGVDIGELIGKRVTA